MVLHNAPMDYRPHRDIFRRFRNGLVRNPNVLAEVLDAFTLLLAEFPPKFTENRFTVGGAVETILAAAMRCVGIAEVETVGFRMPRADIQVGAHLISVKSIWTPASTIGLINSRGGGNVQWEYPTIFVLSGSPNANRRKYDPGIGYADPWMFGPSVVNRTADQLQLPRQSLYKMLRNYPPYFLPCDIARSSDVKQIEHPIALSEIVGKDVLMRSTSGQSLFGSDWRGRFRQHLELFKPRLPLLRPHFDE